MIRSRSQLAVMLAIASVSFACVAQVSALPLNPKAQETVRIIVPQVFNDPASHDQPTYNIVDTQASTVSMSGNRITLSITVARSDFPSVPSATLDIPVGQFPAGTYEVVVNRRTPAGADFGTVGTTSFSVTARSEGEPLWNHTDVWFDPHESGWGINIIQHGSGKIFATWFVYGADRKPTWFVVPDGTWSSPLNYRGPIYRTTGPDYAECTTASCPHPFDPSSVTVESAGEMTLSFHPNFANVAALSMTIDGKTIQKGIQRQGF